ncbi:MAG TPA: CotH kinase family protein, partial [Pontiella sp.]|nr:CotH kinase family protein [Pontiella sp.]
KAAWTTIDVTEVLENGQGVYDGTADRFEFFLQGAGEMLIDDLEFESNGGGNILSNGDFSSGSSGWTFGGVVRSSYVESGAGQDGSAALHLVSVARGDTGCNQADHALNNMAAVGGSSTGTIRAKARWLKGSPYILLRLRGHWMEASLPVNVPTNCGTPGQANSRLVTNAGPAIYDVTHGPVLPAHGEAVVVTARASDPDGISSMSLRYRIDPSASISTVAMHDDGTGGDAVADDGLYSATLPAQSAGTLAAFHVTASDGSVSSQFPAAVPAQECLIRWGETPTTGALGTYRIWMTDANINFWGSRETNANDPLDATFVYGNHRVVYNVGAHYSGSPFHAWSYNGPLGSYVCDYEVNFNPDERFMGSKPFVLLGEGTENTTQADITSTWIGRKLGQQYNHVRHVNVVLNGVRRGEIYMDTQQPNSEMLDEYYPNDSAGQFRKIEDWFEFTLDNEDFAYVTATMERFNDSNGDIDTKRYRWNWRPRTTENHDHWIDFTNLIAEVNDTVTPDFEERVRSQVDIRNFIRPVTVNRIVGNWDSYGYERGKNMYMYKPDDEGWRLMLWDIEFALGEQPWGGGRVNASIYSFHDPVFASMIMSTPAFLREYLMAFQEAVDTVLVPDVVWPSLDERYANLTANGINVRSPDDIKAWIAGRRSYLLSVLPSAGFGVNGPAAFAVSSSSTVLTGTAPLQVADIRVNDIVYPVDWTSATAWSMTVPLNPGTNSLLVAGTDRFGNAVSGASVLLTVTRTNTVEDPLDAVVINEWMADNDTTLADPADGDYEDWFELYNPGTGTVDLGGCYLTDELTEPFEYQIPDNGHYTL